MPDVTEPRTREAATGNCRVYRLARMMPGAAQIIFAESELLVIKSK